MKVRSILFFTLVLLLWASLASTLGQDAFPVTIDHKFGSTIISEEPQRVVSIGFTK